MLKRAAGKRTPDGFCQHLAVPDIGSPWSSPSGGCLDVLRDDIPSGWYCDIVAENAIRDAGARAIVEHAGTIETDITAAIDARKINLAWSAESLALHMQAVLQGAFILAKAKGGAQVAADTIDHLRRYVELLFDNTRHQEEAA